MKKRFTRFIAMIVLLSTIATNVFASTLNIDSETHKDKFNEFEYFDKEYNIESFHKDLLELKPGLNSDEVKLYTQDYIDAYNMFKDMYPEISSKEIAKKASSSLLNKMDYLVDDYEYYKSKNSKVSYEPDGYELVVNYINENLNPGYEATLDTTEKNIAILKKNLDKMNKSDKELAMLYIEDMELEDKLKGENSYTIENTMSRSNNSEKEASLKAVAYAKKYWKNYNSSYPDWDADCANFVSQCLYAGEKTMRHSYPKIDDSRNWFSYGSKKEPSQVSSTWRGANMFKWHWVSRSYAYKDFDLSKNGELSRLYNYAQAGYPISFLNSKDNAYHTLIITGFNNNRKDVGVRNHSGSV